MYGLVAIAVGNPSRRVGVAQRVVIAIGVTIESLGTGGVLHVGVYGEETAGQGIVAAAIHVNEPESCHVLMACKTSVKHGRAGETAAPSRRVTQVAPGIKAQFLLHVALAVGYRGPAAEMVLQDVVDGWSFHDYTIHLQ